MSDTDLAEAEYAEEEAKTDAWFATHIAKCDAYDVAFRQFWSRVDIGTPMSCWPWKGALNSSGYGVVVGHVSRAFREGVAHRISCAIFHRRSRRRKFALHCCDNRSCCNPRHLRWGTAFENSQDVDVALWALHAIDSRAKGLPVPGEYGLKRPTKGRTWASIKSRLTPVSK